MDLQCDLRNLSGWEHAVCLSVGESDRLTGGTGDPGWWYRAPGWAWTTVREKAALARK